MSGSELQTVLRRRLATQRLVGDGLVGATDAVRLLTSSRISPAPRQLDLDPDDLDRGGELICAALSGRRYLTGTELGQVMTDGGLSTDGQRLAYLVMTAELRGLICSGPMRGAQHTYAVLAERVGSEPPWTAEQSGLADPALRRGHAELSHPVPVAPGHPHPPDAELFIGSVLVDAVNVGTWRRTVRGTRLRVETVLSPDLDRRGRDAVAEAVVRLPEFLDTELEA